MPLQEAGWARGRVAELESQLGAAAERFSREEARTERLQFELTMREEDEADLSEEVDLLRKQVRPCL